MNQCQLEIGDSIGATQYGQQIEGRVCELAANGVFID